MTDAIKFILNGRPVSIETDGERRLLWVLRSDFGLTGPKYGCGEGVCGACTVLVDNEAVLSCQRSVKEFEGASIVTIEGTGPERQPSSVAERVCRTRGVPVRFLHPGDDLARPQPSVPDCEAVEGTNRRRNGKPHLPLRCVQPDCSGRAKRREGHRRGGEIMNSDTAKNMEGTFGGGEFTRRQFLKRLGVLGGGLVVYFTVGDIPVSARMKREGFLGAKIPVDFNAFLRIGTDERVALLTGKIEMGQGVMTSLPQLLAEEMNVSYDMVDIVMGDTDLCPWDAGTFGSLSIRYFGIFLREAACEAKAVLMQMAAQRLKVPVDALAVENGTIFAKGAKNKKVTYGQLTQGKIIERHLETLPPLKPVSEFTVMGTPRQRRDAIQKVTGEAKFAADMRLPGMLYAKILRPPAHGAKLIGCRCVGSGEAQRRESGSGGGFRGRFA